MLDYFLYTKDTDSDSDLEVHNVNCNLRFNKTLKELLGKHPNCYSAVSKAKSLEKYKYRKIDGCKFCCPDCHTS